MKIRPGYVAIFRRCKQLIIEEKEKAGNTNFLLFSTGVPKVFVERAALHFFEFLRAAQLSFV